MASFLVSILGLELILKISVPVLTLLYPVAIAIIVINLLPFAWAQKPVVHRAVTVLAFARQHLVYVLRGEAMTTQVVAALIWRGGKFLICQRPAHKARGLLWEFVGGKVEPGETKTARRLCANAGKSWA